MFDGVLNDAQALPGSTQDEHATPERGLQIFRLCSQPERYLYDDYQSTDYE